MQKTLMAHAVVLGAASVMVAGMFAQVAVAEGSKSDRGATPHAGHGTPTQARMVSDTRVFGTPTNDNIAPAAGSVTSTSPRSNNTYGTTGSQLREDIRQGR